ncbi:MAG: flagellar biosynthesis anti-sigma factor FlgM [Novosphingobium sp.]
MPVEPLSSAGQARAISATDPRTTRLFAGERDKLLASKSSFAFASPVQTPKIQASDALDPGPVPVDTDRVSLIRKAVETGTYPVVPARIADAVIAAGLLLRTAQ